MASPRSGVRRRPAPSIPPLASPQTSPRFRRWVRAYGVKTLARALQTTRTNVYAWMAVRTPRLATAQQLLWLSRRAPCGVGPLEWRDLYGGLKPSANPTATMPS